MTYDDIKRRYADGYMDKTGQAIEDVAWLLHAYAGACDALDGRDRIERERDELRAALTHARATNAKLHRRTQAAEAAIADALREAARQVAAAEERARVAESSTATVRRARAFVAARHAEVDAVAAALAEGDTLRAALLEAQRELDELRQHLWPLANALGIQGDQPLDWRPDVALLVEVTCKDMARQRTEVQQLRTQVEQYRTRDAAHEFAAKARIESAERERDELRDEVARLRAELAEADRMDAGARRVEAARCGIDDPDDTPSCLADFADEIIRLRAALAEVLGWMTRRGTSISGVAFVRSVWVKPERVAELRRLVDGGR